MAHGLFGSVDGPDGEVWITSLGVKVAVMRAWRLTARRNEAGQPNGTWDLKTELSYVMPLLLKDPDHVKEFTLRVSRQKQYRVELEPTAVTQLVGKTLLIKGVRLIS